MPSEKGLSLRGTGSLTVSRNWLRETTQQPPSGGVKAIKDSLSPFGNGLRLRGAVVVQPNTRSSDHPMARSSPAKAVMGRKKVEKVMHEYKDGALKSSSGEKVTTRDQAVAIAMSESGLSRKRRKR